MELKDIKKQIPYRWKVQSFNKDQTKGSCVAYIDARDVMDLLDDVVGPSHWQDKYEFVGDKLIAGIGILTSEGWIWKYDTGTESATEGEKGIFSDAFKRAAVKWGIGRFLYDLDIKWIDIQNKKPVDKNGNIIWDLTKHFSVPSTSDTPTQTKIVTPVAPPEVHRDKTTCPECGAPTTEKSGISKAGNPYHGFFCTANRDHKPIFVKDASKPVEQPKVEVKKELPLEETVDYNAVDEMPF